MMNIVMMNHGKNNGVLNVKSMQFTVKVAAARPRQNMQIKKSETPQDSLRYLVLFCFGSYPLASIASASSSLLWKAEINSGTIKEMMALNFVEILPCLKSTPREDWAFIMRSTSSNSVGINLKAIEIVIATSWVGNLMTLSGDKNHSRAYVNSNGLVVAVKINDRVIINTKRMVIFTLCNMAST